MASAVQERVYRLRKWYFPGSQEGLAVPLYSFYLHYNTPLSIHRFTTILQKGKNSRQRQNECTRSHVTA